MSIRSKQIDLETLFSLSTASSDNDTDGIERKAKFCRPEFRQAPSVARIIVPEFESRSVLQPPNPRNLPLPDFSNS